MSVSLSVEEIQRKISDRIYRTFERDATKNDLWKLRYKLNYFYCQTSTIYSFIQKYNFNHWNGLH